MTIAVSHAIQTCCLVGMACTVFLSLYHFIRNRGVIAFLLWLANPFAWIIPGWGFSNEPNNEAPAWVGRLQASFFVTWAYLMFRELMNSPANPLG